MAKVRPFRGIRYNQDIVKNPGDVICPPHDIIPDQLQEELYHHSPYNFVRIEYGRQTPQDNSQDNRYTRAATLIEKWIKENVFISEAEPVLYVHDYYFRYENKTCRRRGIIAQVKLEEWSEKVIMPHEGTLSQSKTDRLSLLWACQANTSPVLAMFEDKKQRIAALIDEETSSKPVIVVPAADGEGHLLWAVDNPKTINSVCQALAEKSLYIADGHHRYESALTFKHEKAECSPSTSEEPYDYIMMTLVDLADPGLLVLPPHRLVRGISKTNLHDLERNIASFFDSEDLPINTPHIWSKLGQILCRSNGTVTLGLYGLQPGIIQILTLRDNEAASKLMPCFHSDIYKSLDVSIVDHLILEKLATGGDIDRLETTFSYVNREAVRKVQEEQYQLALLLSPISPDVIKAIADAGDRMPRKSTYFYPKEPAGLVFNRLI